MRGVRILKTPRFTSLIQMGLIPTRELGELDLYAVLTHAHARAHARSKVRQLP